ncbi:hypothetical protein Sjap_021762 [Stephania japonica]|uniref:GDSL esterase/lipase n=1 Tax=Stephania japonica TaxID=461633 RepID=A0AAP0EML6_9MAGN
MPCATTHFTTSSALDIEMEGHSYLSKAEGLAIPYLHAYLDAVAPNFSTGANFATASSTIVPSRDVLPLGGYSPFSLNVQYSQFIRLKNDSSIIDQLGAVISESKSIQEIRASIPIIVSNFSANVKSLYEEGGRSFWIHNTGPIGCLPYTFVPFPVASSQIDSAGCAIPYNDLSQYFNQKLKESVVQLRKDLPLAAITYVDMYSIKYTLISQASKFGKIILNIASI